MDVRPSRTGSKKSSPPEESLCGYRLMWVLVMFDLPVGTKEERKAASDFRLDLLDLGFERCQYSVYLRFAEGYSQAEAVARRVRNHLPEGGRVYVLFFTDKQYEAILRYENNRPMEPFKNPGQFALF